MQRRAGLYKFFLQNVSGQFEEDDYLNSEMAEKGLPIINGKDRVLLIKNEFIKQVGEKNYWGTVLYKFDVAKQAWSKKSIINNIP